MSDDVFIPDPNKDQFFVISEDLLEKITKFGELSRNDVVLEVGAGKGNLTRKLAAAAGRVIAFEIDERLENYLTDLPSNVEMHFEDAWKYVQLHGKFRKRKEYNKVVSNLPYSFVEPFLHNLTFLDFDKVILLVPKSTVQVLQTHPIFSSFFQVEIKLQVGPENFEPRPKTNSAVIDLKHLPDPVENKDLGLFLRQYIYQREEKKVKNSLQEGIIDFSRMALGEFVSKKQAIKIIKESGIDRELLESIPRFRIYEQVSARLGNQKLIEQGLLAR